MGKCGPKLGQGGRPLSGLHSAEETRKFLWYKQRQRNVKEVFFVFSRVFVHLTSNSRRPYNHSIMVPWDIFLSQLNYEKKLKVLADLWHFLTHTAYSLKTQGTLYNDYKPLSKGEMEKVDAELEIVYDLYHKLLDGSLEPLGFGDGFDIVLPLDEMEKSE